MRLQAFQAFRWAQRVAYGMLGGAGLLAAAAPALGQASATTYISLTTAAALSGIVAWQCGINKQKLVFVDYVQAEH